MNQGSKPKAGGRVKGTPNKDTTHLFAICEKHGVDVFEAMVICATQATDIEVKFRFLSDLATYLYPKRKSIEVSADEHKGFEVVIRDYTSK